MRRIASLAALLLASAAQADEIWISNEKDNTLSVIDTATLEVTRTIPTGERPRGIAFSHDHSRLYICASDSDAVQVMDPVSGEILFDLPSGEDPEQFVLHPDDRHLWIANEDDAVTTVVDVETVSPDGATVVTTSETTNMAHWIDTATQQIYANTLVESRPRHAEFVKHGTELWVSSEIGGSITVFDTATRAEKARITFAMPDIHADRIQPVGFELTADESLAFVALGPANHVAVVNAETYEVEDYILVGRRVWHMAFDGDKSRLFTTNGISGDVTVIDVARRKALKTIKVGRFPWGAAFRPTP